MAKFSYIAKTQEGETQKGGATAENEFQLARILREQGLVLISAQEQGQAKKGKKIEIPFLARVSLVEKMMFTRNLRIMVSAGIPLPRSLETLSLQAKSKKFRQTLLDIKDEIIRGKSFSDALKKHSDVFPELFFSMIKVGEEGGRLEEVLQILTRQMERDHELKSKIMGAMMYPVVIICAMLGIGALMLIMVVPKIAQTFQELNIPLPATTQFVIWLGETLAHKWYLVLGIIIALPILLWRLTKSKPGKKIMDTVLLRMPIISSIIRQTNSAYTVRILSSLITAGVPIAESLEILSGALGNVHYQNVMALAADEVRKGTKLSDVLKNYQRIYPLLVIQMVAVGEETGQTSEILDKLADFFEEGVTNATKNLASILEPIIMLLVGGAVGFFAISMIQPMYSMLGAIK